MSNYPCYISIFFILDRKLSSYPTNINCKKITYKVFQSFIKLTGVVFLFHFVNSVTYRVNEAKLEIRVILT